MCLSVRVRYVFHSAGIFLDPSYQNRVQYLGQPGTRNCSLRFSDLRQSDSGTYVFYLITSHPTQKMPAQSGIQLLVAGGDIIITYFTLIALPQLIIMMIITATINIIIIIITVNHPHNAELFTELQST